MNTLIDGYQRHRMAETGAPTNYIDNTSEINELRRRVDVLGIACEALWGLLQTHAGLDSAVIFQKMKEIDARDGRLDGKSAPDVIDCPACLRTNNTLAANCMYCGAPLTTANAAV